MHRTSQDRSSTTVLVASSDAHLRSLLAWTLAQDERFEVVAQAKDGDEVLACPESFRVEVVDVSIGGLGILGVMRRLKRRTDGPIVVVVGHESASYVRHALALEGAADYLLLPEDVDDLTQRISETSDTPSGPEPSTSRPAA